MWRKVEWFSPCFHKLSKIVSSQNPGVSQLENIPQWAFNYYLFKLSGEATDHLAAAFHQDEQGNPAITNFLDGIQNSVGGEKRCLSEVQGVQIFMAFCHSIFEKEAVDKTASADYKACV